MKTIQIRTEIPGPHSRALMARREAAIPRGPYHATPLFAAKAEGAVIEDVDGNRFLDFAGGIGCLNVGHRAPRVIAAIREQLEKFLHVCFSVTPYESYIAVAEKLNALAPGKFPKKTFILNTGAEAVENAIKIARAYTKRPAMICFEDAFHGRTLLAMSLTSKTHPYKAGFAPFASDIYRIPYAYWYRAEKGATARKFCASSGRRIQARSGAGVRRRGNCGTGARRRWFCRAAPRLLPHCFRKSAASTASCSSPTKSNPESPAPENGLPRNISASNRI